MCAQATPEEDRTASVNRSLIPWYVVAVQALPDYRLKVRFFDGTEGTVDISDCVHTTRPNMFKVLADEDLFAKVFIRHGIVMWPGNIDLPPDAMHAEILARGEWRLM